MKLKIVENDIAIKKDKITSNLLLKIYKKKLFTEIFKIIELINTNKYIKNLVIFFLVFLNVRDALIVQDTKIPQKKANPFAREILIKFFKYI